MAPRSFPLLALQPETGACAGGRQLKGVLALYPAAASWVWDLPALRCSVLAGWPQKAREEDSVPLVLKPLPLLSRVVTSENLPSPLPPLAVPHSCWGRLVLGQLLRSPPPLPQLPLLRVPSASSQLSSFSWGSPPALSQAGGSGGSSRGQLLGQAPPAAPQPCCGVPILLLHQLPARPGAVPYALEAGHAPLLQPDILKRFRKMKPM